MLYINTVKLDNQSRFYVDSKMREALGVEPGSILDISCVDRVIVITAHDDKDVTSQTCAMDINSELIKIDRKLKCIRKEKE